MKKLALMFLVLCCGPGLAQAGGFKFPSNGSVALGRGGAFTVLADDLVCLEFNPGGLVKLAGTHIYLGDNISIYNIDFTGYNYNKDTSEFYRAKTVSNEAGPLWLAPFIGISSDFGLQNWRFSIGLFGPSANGSGSFDEDEDLDENKNRRPHHYLMLDKSVSLAFYTLGVAYGRKNKFGVGLSLHWMDLMRADFTMYVNSYWLAHPDKASSNYDVRADMQVSDRFAFGFTLGGWWRPVEFLEIGASFMGPNAKFKATGHTTLGFQGELVANLYDSAVATMDDALIEGLLPYDSNGKPTTELPTSFNLTYPMTARLGIRYLHETGPEEERYELFDVEFDVVWEGWSALDAYDIDIDGYIQLSGTGVPGGESDKLEFEPVTITKNYKDTWSFRLGGQYRVIDWLTLRAGTYFETGAVPPAYTNVDFASFNRFGLAAGLSLEWRFLKFSAAYSHIFQKDREIATDESKVYKHYPVQSEAPEGDQFVAGAGTYETSYDIWSFALAFKF